MGCKQIKAVPVGKIEKINKEKSSIYEDEDSETQQSLANLVAELSDALADSSAEIERLNKKLVDRDERIGQLSLQLNKIYSSSSWRFTAPLRKLSRTIVSFLFITVLIIRKIILAGGLRAAVIKVLNRIRIFGFSPLLFAAKQQLQNEIAYNYSLREICIKVFKIIRNEGIEGVRKRILHRPLQNKYQDWIAQYDLINNEVRYRINARMANFNRMPKISVIMPVYDPPPIFLDEAIWSVRKQIYPEWELCIADDASKNPEIKKLLQQHALQDARIKIVFRDINGHISAASNSALQISTGEFIALLDHDDLLPEHALFCVAETILDHPEVALIYSDEDKVTEAGDRYDPYFKCDFNPELMLAQNMVSHLGVYQRDILNAIGGFKVGYEGSQDYDLALRVIDKVNQSQIKHIPRILYHWRAIPGSTALSGTNKNYAVDAGRRAVADHLKRRGLEAEVLPTPELPGLNRVKFSLPENKPFVSIIIPTRDRADLLATCVNSVLHKSTYANMEIVIVDNGSVEPRTFKLFDELQKNNVKVVRDEGYFNFSRLNNYGVSEAQGEFLCLMNNDIEILTLDWLEEMLSFAMQPDIGCVGARLWYPSGNLQHGGVILGFGGVANHSHYNFPKGAAGYFGRALLHQSYSAVTAACLVVRRQVFEAVGGFDESLAVAFNDVDFCLRVREAGYRNVWTPYAEMIHYESVSRGAEDNPEKQARFAAEVHLMQERWGSDLLNDPAYNPNLSLQHENFTFAWPPRVAPC